MELAPKVLSIFNFNEKNPMKLKNKASIYKIILSLMTVCAFVLAVELCARFDDMIKYGAPFWGDYSANLLRTYDSEGIRVNVPNVRFEKWKNNKFGFRGKESDIHKSENIIRIACLGTSETYGLYEQENNEWPSQLNALLIKKGISSPSNHKKNSWRTATFYSAIYAVK